MKKFASFVGVICMAGLTYISVAAAMPCDSDKQCSKAQTVAKVDGCCASKAAATVAKVDDVASSCGSKAAAVAKIDGKASCASQCSKAAATVAKIDETQCSSKANYVAFECETADQIARASAKAYLDVIAAVKKVSGAEGCSAQCATNVLASMMDAPVAGRVVAKVDTISNCASPCGTTAAVAKIDGKANCASPCSTTAAVAKIDGKANCASQCSKTAAVAKIDTAASQCSQSKTVAVGTCGNVAKVDNAPSCCASKKAAATVAKIDTPADCAAQCAKTAKALADCASQCSKAAATVAKVDETQCSSKASYVAFGCEKSDTIARAAAKAYMNVLASMKKASGSDGCAKECAGKTLANVINDIQGERTVAAKIDAVPTATCAKTQSTCSKK